MSSRCGALQLRRSNPQTASHCRRCAAHSALSSNVIPFVGRSRSLLRRHGARGVGQAAQQRALRVSLRRRRTQQLTPQRAQLARHGRLVRLRLGDTRVRCGSYITTSPVRGFAGMRVCQGTVRRARSVASAAATHRSLQRIGGRARAPQRFTDVATVVGSATSKRRAAGPLVRRGTAASAAGAVAQLPRQRFERSEGHAPPRAARRPHGAPPRRIRRPWGCGAFSCTCGLDLGLLRVGRQDGVEHEHRVRRRRLTCLNGQHSTRHTETARTYHNACRVEPQRPLRALTGVATRPCRGAGCTGATQRQRRRCAPVQHL